MRLEDAVKQMEQWAWDEYGDTRHEDSLGDDSAYAWEYLFIYHGIDLPSHILMPLVRRAHDLDHLIDLGYGTGLHDGMWEAGEYDDLPFPWPRSGSNHHEHQ